MCIYFLEGKTNQLKEERAARAGGGGGSARREAFTLLLNRLLYRLNLQSFSILTKKVTSGSTHLLRA